LDEFSMSPARIPTVKQLIRRLDSTECRHLADQALKASTAEEVKALVKAFFAERQIGMD